MNRILVAAAAGVALLALVVPWAGYEAEGRFSIQGCSGDTAAASYHLFYSTRTLEGDAPCPIFHVPYSLESQDGSAGIDVLRAGGPLVVAGAFVAVAAIALRHRLGEPLAALLAALLLATGAGLIQGGATARAAIEKEGPFGDLVNDPDAFGMGPGLWLAYLATLTLLVAAGLAIMRLRTPAEPDVFPAPSARPAPAAPAGPGVSPPLPFEPAESAPDPGVRKLACPRCKHTFTHRSGVPTCPECKYTRAASVK